MLKRIYLKPGGRDPESEIASYKHLRWWCGLNLIGHAVFLSAIPVFLTTASRHLPGARQPPLFAWTVTSCGRCWRTSWLCQMFLPSRHGGPPKPDEPSCTFANSFPAFRTEKQPLSQDNR